jgi:tRNA-2-methylthio-N6-dimethylallyladenosine synthase
MPKKYFIKTFGCQMNISDSERIAAFLEKNSLKKASNTEEANLIILNTCSVRQMAEDRVYGQIHNLNEQRSKNNNQQKIILTGCLANRKDVQRRMKNKVDLFCEVKDFPQKMEELLQETKKTASLLQEGKRDYLSIIPKYSDSFSAYVPVMTGCNNFCAYCAVPFARGQETSRPADEILKEIKSLLKKGCKEVVLLGQNVNSYYGTYNVKQKTKKINFSQLLRKVNALPGNFWISFISNHPKDFSDELIETAASLKKVCEYIHLPLQSGDNEILKKMNRHYTFAHYLRLIRKIKNSFKKYKPEKIYSLTSDIIVGFPGETRKHFLNSAKIMETVGYDLVYFGQFSPRPGTAAAKMKDNVNKKEKVRREEHLNEILKKTALKNNLRYVNTELEVLLEKKSDEFYFGRTRTMKNVKILSDKKNLVGKFVKVKITKANTWNLEGKIK